MGFLLLLTLPLPFTLWRMSLESSTWVDEIYTYLLSQLPVARIIDLTTNDAHPPLQYLLVKTWYHIGRWFWSEPGVFWGRGMNLVPWAAMAAAAWFGGRALLGRSGGTLFAWVVTLSAQIATMTQWLRGYAVVCAALFLCFMLLLLLDPGAGFGVSARRQILGWSSTHLAVQSRFGPSFSARWSS